MHKATNHELRYILVILQTQLLQSRKNTRYQLNLYYEWLKCILININASSIVQLLIIIYYQHFLREIVIYGINVDMQTCCLFLL